ncbi:GIY-YIG nuclease family protein [Microbacterium esteraromaticum]|nr:GIY-YIG nuclease family protein [Microbacterium esteraromaticum]
MSNIGSFGPDVVKIGLTRRLEPMDRVNELGDASVPFRFDVHALFFADDAVSIEAMLHQHFADRRINQINMRREYFRTTPTEVREVLKAHSVELLDFKLEPAAEEHLAIRALQGI